MRQLRNLALPLVLLAAGACGGEGELSATLESHPEGVRVHDFVELTVRVEGAGARGNPFTDVRLEGEFRSAVEGEPVERSGEPVESIDGFCDSADGRVHRLRFMPLRPGRYDYVLRLSNAGRRREFRGSIEAVAGATAGPLRIDPEHPRHLMRAGAGHFFWNGTTAYWLMGLRDDAEIRGVLDRLAAKRVNTVRVLLYGRHHDAPWGRRTVRTAADFRLLLEPWPALYPDDVERPGFDLTRFEIGYWRRFERMLAAARERGITVSVVFYMSHPPGSFHAASIPPAAGGADEERYFRYAVARFAAFSNVTWDLGNEHDLYRRAGAWPASIGRKVRAWDPYDHLVSVHNWARSYLDSDWYDLLLEQAWDGHRGLVLHDYMLELRREQGATGRPVPVINAEYGYEDVLSRNTADSRRRMAWEICMAGCYGTTGESDRLGGGWANGRGDASMTLLDGVAHIPELFEGLPWWTLEPRDDLVSDGAMCLARPGSLYVVYLPGPLPVEVYQRSSARRTTVSLAAGRYRARWFDPRRGGYIALPAAPGGREWTSPVAPDEGDWVLLLEREDPDR